MKESPMSNSTQLILDFMDCWERFDLADALSRISDDASFTPDLLSEPVVGREALTKLWSFYMEMMQGYRMEVVNIVGSDRVVCLERIEYVVTPTQENVVLPIVGVYELDAHGRITAWRDYVESTMLPK